MFSDRVKFSVLEKDGIQEIHQATLNILGRTGVYVDHPEALKLCDRAGCSVDGNKVKFLAKIIEESLESAPRKIDLWDRLGTKKLPLEDKNTYFGTGSDCVFIRDVYSGERRECVKKDIENTAHLIDNLSNIDFVMSMGIPSDVPAEIEDKVQFLAMLLNTKKPIVFTASNTANLADIFEMSAIVAGGVSQLKEKPFLALYAEPITPLNHIHSSLEKLLYCAENSIPVIYTPAPIAGATSPVTLAGTLVVTNAELLSGLVISQLARKGSPFIYGGSLGAMDMKTTTLPYASPEAKLLDAAIAEMGQHYQLPVFGTGGCSDSKVFDQQAGSESTLTILMAALSGANLIHDVGYLELGLTASYEMIIITDEIISMVKRILAGIKISKETLAEDEIERVGPGGNYLTSNHTLKHFKNELWFPRLFDRDTYEGWKKAGSKDMATKAKEKAQELLRLEQTASLPQNIVDKVTSIAEKVNHKG